MDLKKKPMQVICHLKLIIIIVVYIHLFICFGLKRTKNHLHSSNFIALYNIILLVLKDLLFIYFNTQQLNDQ